MFLCHFDTEIEIVFHWSKCNFHAQKYPYQYLNTLYNQLHTLSPAFHTLFYTINEKKIERGLATVSPFTPKFNNICKSTASKELANF